MTQARPPTTVSYRSMITIFLCSELDDMDTADIWFQFDGATQPKTKSIFYPSDFLAWLFHAEATTTVHRDRAI